MFFLCFRTLLIYIVITFAIRFMGKRQLGELQPTELVSTVLLSNLASICIEDPSLPILYSIVPVMVIAVIELFNSAIAFRIPAYARLLSGKSVTAIHNGTVDQIALKKMRLSMSDLLKALRSQGCFSPNDAALAIVETDGSLSVLPLEKKDKLMLPVVADSCVLQDNLQYLGRDQTWLEEQLRQNGISLKSGKLLLALSNGKDFQLIQEKRGSS